MKGVGVDCAMLLVRVYCDLNLIEPFDPRPYTRDWMLHRDEEKYLGFLLSRARTVEEPGRGDVILFKVGRCFAHGGIVTKTDPLTMTHAYSQAGFVIEDEVEPLPARPAATRLRELLGGAMSWFSRKKSDVKPDYTGLQLQTAVSTLPIPIVWGRNKLAGNVIWYQRFVAAPSYSGGKGAGGKGGLGGGHSVTGYTYQADIIIALCEGPIAGIPTVWKDLSVYYTPLALEYADLQRRDAARRMAVALALSRAGSSLSGDRLCLRGLLRPRLCGGNREPQFRDHRTARRNRRQWDRRGSGPSHL